VKHSLFKHSLLPAAVALAAVLAGCHSSNSSALVVPVGSLGSVVPGGAVSTTSCGSGTTNSGIVTLATATPLQLAPLGTCTATVTFQTGTTVSGSIAVASSATNPANAPVPLPASPNASPLQPILFETLSFPAGASVSIPTTSGSPAEALTLASTTGCTTFFQTAGGAASNPATTLQGWQPFGNSGVTASGTTATFPSGQNGSTVTLGDPTVATTYFLLFACT
jgi:hypothetical protein